VDSAGDEDEDSFTVDGFLDKAVLGCWRMRASENQDAVQLIDASLCQRFGIPISLL